MTARGASTAVPLPAAPLPPAAAGPAIGPAELEALYRAHYQYLLRVAMLALGGTAAAEDIVQEAFIRVYAARSAIRDADRIPAYLRMTTLNLARSTLRRREIARRCVPAAPAEAAGTEEQVLARVRDASVRDALRQLPSRQQQVIMLRYYADLSVLETARTLQISTGSVKTHGSRALATLARTVDHLR
jgi:RNA polymerase sigma-70 factor (sigma-E family)